MSGAAPTVFTTSELDDLEFARAKRRQVIDEITKDGIPNDDGQLGLILSALNDTERSVVGSARLRLQSKSDQTNNQTAALLSQLLLATKPAQHQVGGVTGNEPDTMPPSIEHKDFVEGELTMENKLIDYETIIQQDSG